MTLEVSQATDLAGEDVQSHVQDRGQLSEQHLPHHFRAAAVSRQVATQERHQMIGCEVLQLCARVKSTNRKYSVKQARC